MQLTEFINKIKANENVSFEATLSIIAENYHYHPCCFHNGIGASRITNEVGSNEGSCKIFAFAKIHTFTEEQTLSLFGDYYRLEVLNDPHGKGHQNIRNFMKYGWEGIEFENTALTSK
jgi:type III HopJ-like effector protein